MAPNYRTQYDKTPLKRAPCKFYDTLKVVLSVAGDQYLTTGWKALAGRPELEISAEKFAEFERAQDPASQFLHYLVFEHPRQNEMTVERLEELARKINNVKIIQEFSAIKKELHQQKLRQGGKCYYG